MFWKKKPIVVTLFTHSEEYLQLSKPERATKFFPKWWKELAVNNANNDKVDMKNCIGFLDLYRHGIMIPAWSEIRVQVAPKGSLGYSWIAVDGKTMAEEHAQSQKGTYRDEKEQQHIKFLTPWGISCSEDIQFLLLDPFWHKESSEIITPTGMTRFKLLSELNVNLFFERKEVEHEYMIELNQPLVHIIPITDRPVVYEYEVVSYEEYRNRTALPYHGTRNRFRKYLKLLEEKKSIKRCPFGFGGDK